MLTKDSNIDVVITYGWNRVAFNVLRTLSLKGLKVAVGDNSSIAMGKYSRHCHYVFSYPSFYSNPKNFIESLKFTFKKLRPKVYIPIHEETFVVAKYKHEFDELGVKIPVHDFQVIRHVHRKDSFHRLVERLNLPVPKTFKPKDLTELKIIWNELKGKVVIKLINTNSAKGVFYINSEDELIKTYTCLVEKFELCPEQYPIIQEYVDGDGYGVSMLFNHGKLRAKFTHKRIREKLATGGTSTKRVSIRNPVIEEYAEHLLSSLNWHGVVMIEFKYNEKEKKAWIIEANPRFWGSLALPIYAGVDFPFLLYKMAIDGDVEPVTEYKEGVAVRWFLGDIFATLSLIKAERSIKPLINFFSYKGEKFDDLHRDDLKPFFIECLYYLSKFIKTADLNPTQEALLDIDKI